MRLALGMREVNKPLNLSDRESRKLLAKFLNGFAKVVATNNGIGQDACSAYYRPTRHLTGYPFDRFAARRRFP